MATSSAPPKSAFSSSSDHKTLSEPPHSASSSTIYGTTSTKRVVSTAPPWARDEPPEDEHLRPGSALSPPTRTSSHERVPSDVASMTSSSDPPHQNSWWTFTGPRRKPPPPSQQPSPDEESPVDDQDGEATPTHDLEKGRSRRMSRIRPQMRLKNRSSWLSRYVSGVSPAKDKDIENEKEAGREGQRGVNEEVLEEDSGEDQDQNDEEERNDDEADEERDHFDAVGPSTSVAPPTSTRSRIRRGMGRRFSSNTLRLDMPLAPAPFTKAQAETPGWDSPWNPHRSLAQPDAAHTREANGTAELRRGHSTGQFSASSSTAATRRKRGNPWKRKADRIRHYFLHNLYVPLIFRVLNLAFTSATLGVAVRIRRLERDNSVLGILGSSSTLTIIFGPVTLLHVLIATWLEYFGRPLGLWKTSWKLSYTLIEVVLICAWSAALGLCFNDYFTTPLQCAPRSVNKWWDQLPANPNPLADKMRDDEAGNLLCDEQLALICIAFITLASYCSSLVISLFRIIEKVKFHSTTGGRTYTY